MARTTRVITNYEILSLCPANGLKAVYAYRIDGEGCFELRAEPMTHIAVASATEETIENDDEIGGGYRKLKETKIENVVVGILFGEGRFHICEEDSNFSGLLQPGGKIEDATSNLNREEFPLRLMKKT